jgi:hypothetical protein
MDREVDRDLLCPRTRNLDVEKMLQELTFSCAHQTGADKPCACIIWWTGESEDFEFRVRRIGRVNVNEWSRIRMPFIYRRDDEVS